MEQGTVEPKKASGLILYVDDNNDDANFFQEALDETHPDFEVWHEKDGQEALDALQGLKEKGRLDQVAFVVLDVRMPRKDGIEVLIEMKADPAFQKIPVIVWSGSGVQQNMVRAYSHGASSFMEKPASYEALLTKVRELVDFWRKL
jgi:two-component system response regulator